MKRGPRLRSMAVVTVLALAIAILVTPILLADPAASAGQLVGSSVTLLPDGNLLLLGGQDSTGVLASGEIKNGQTGTATPLQDSLEYPRAWHTATVLPDGTVAIIGGIGTNGVTVASVERFDPKTKTFSSVNVTGLTPRSHHTATLLSDGEVLIVGGVSASDKTLGSAQLWDPQTNQVTSVPQGLATPRHDQTATLLSDGNVLIQSGIDANGRKVTSSEIYDTQLDTFVPAPVAEKTSSAASSVLPAPSLAGSIPTAGASGVSVNTIISLRFSEPMNVSTVDSDTVTLLGPDGFVTSNVVAAQGGMLAFVNPQNELSPNSKYTVTVNGATASDGTLMARAKISFTTGSGATTGVGTVGAPIISSSSGSSSSSTSVPSVWVPTSDWRTDLPPSPWQSLPPLRAQAGVTALSGQVLTINGMPLANVTLQIGSRRVMTDSSGRFLMLGVPSGKSVLLIDGTSANHGGATFGTFQVSVYIDSRITNVLPYTIWMPVLDMAHAVTIPSPTTQETVISNPLIPGLELRIPAGTTITNINGKVVHTISITPIPLDRPPFPLPAGVRVPIYFTIQPGGAQLWASNGKWALAQLYYPNPAHFGGGTRFDFWNYDPVTWGWYVYGHGSVTKDGSEVVPDPGVGIWTFSGAMVGSPGEPPTTHGPGCQGGCDPVDTSSGIFVHGETDLRLADVIPIKLTRTYLSQYPTSGPFGIGFTDSYEMYLTNDGAPNYTTVDVVMPDGQKIHYVNTTTDQTSWTAAHYVATLTSVPAFYGSVITWNTSNNNGWLLTLRNGTVYAFPANGTSAAGSALLSITDRNGNTLTITRDSNGNITQITSPNGRWVQFTHDSSNRITQATDDLGRTVTYTYDTCGSGYLCSVTNANGDVTNYSYYTSSNPPPSGYGGLGDMSKIVNPRGNTAMTLLYDTNGRVVKQTLADGSTYQFAYTLSGGSVTQASITDPNGNVEQKSFDSNGFRTSDTYAAGTSVQQTYNFTRDPSTELVTSVTDPLGRETCYAYDANGNLTSVTRLCGTSNAVTTSMTYTSNFNELASITNPLGHTWSMGYDSRGNLTSITDPLGDQTTLAYNFMGQLTSTTDAANDTIDFGYSYGDLTSITDPLGNVTRRFFDGAGRMVSLTDPLGKTTVFTYDNTDHLTQITDANGNTTKFSYDPDGDLVSVTDANGNATTYTYDSRDRRISRTDALGKSDTYSYDGDSNLTSHTDRDGNVTDYQYDALNRRTFVGYGASTKGQNTSYQSTVNYTWDAGNRLTQVVDSIAGTIKRTYDGLNRLTDETTPQGEVSYKYDNAGRRKSMTVSGQATVNYSWDNANRLTAIQGTNSVDFSYDAANRRTQLTLPNGIVVGYSYDSDSHVTGMTWAMGGNQLGNLTYAYDADGRVISKGGSFAQNNLPAAASGNTFNADNSMTAFNGNSLSYDANGNLTSDGTYTYTWDARNHLTQITQKRTTVATFQYDAFGRRVEKTVNGVTTQYLYDGLNPVEELNGASPASVTETMLTGLGIDQYFARTNSSGTTSSYLTDMLGSTIALANSSGTIATQYSYEPFGATTVSGSSTNPFQFTGRENDGTGLYYYRARYYSPTYGRFISQDPLGFGGGDPNLYGYTGNDPLNSVDPLGWVNFLVGRGVSVVAVTGVEFSGGVYVNPGWFGEQADEGVFGTAGAGEGLNVSTDVFFGVISGNSGNIAGLTVDENLVLGPFSLTILTDPVTRAIAGFTLGVGPSATPVGASTTTDETVTHSLNSPRKQGRRPCP